MNKWICQICGYIYDETKEATAFSDLPESWTCPLCGASKSAFRPEQTESPTATQASQTGSGAGEEFLSAPGSESSAPTSGALSYGALAALCSNLARGCEKQYLPEAAGLYQSLADFFTAGAPAVPDGSLETLIGRLEQDLETGYPQLRAQAQAVGDRGTLRICVWGEKVTRILLSQLRRYEKEGEAFLENNPVWVCSVCGFLYVGQEPPQLCPVCKVPAWKFEKTQGRA